MEIWKDIKGYEGLYQDSNLGKVKSLVRYSSGTGRNRRKLRERILKVLYKSNYQYVRLYKNSKYINEKIHHLVFIHFLGKKEIGKVIDHIDNDKNNNKESNLQSITIRKNNSKDTFRKKKSSKYVGVFYDKANCKFRSLIFFDNKSICLGRYIKEITAHHKYKKALKIVESNISNCQKIIEINYIKHEQTTN